MLEPLRQLLRRPAPPAEYCATIVVMSAVTKLDALAIVALAVDRPVERQRTMRPFVPLDGAGYQNGAWVEIEIPKFGEPPPLAIDVYSTISDDHARLQALTLLARLEQYTGWRIRPDFSV
ncbi:hypothetical protein [Microcella sp.]|uniref:hypothetical protein n=1 Tax=Microcella sp. TaxID=1913979 RepID=UPI003F71194A